MRKLLAFALLAASPALAQDAPEPVTPSSVIAAAPASDWRAIDPADLLVMTLAPGRDGQTRQVVIQLIPAPFSEGWVGNIRTMARAHWWDGLSVYRVVDNWVAQWGDVDEAKSVPEGFASPEAPYEVEIQQVPLPSDGASPPITMCPAGEDCPAPRMAIPEARRLLSAALRADAYADDTYFNTGWPLALDMDSFKTWPLHCYAHVGVARSVESTGTGSELYAVIGHAPRQLDRNIAVVGRVIEGIEHLSTLPRGRGDAGVYDKPELRTPIVSVRLGDELPDAEQPRFEYLGSDTDSFARYVHVRANRNDAFYKVPAGGIDVCNVQVPIRRVAAP